MQEFEFVKNLVDYFIQLEEDFKAIPDIVQHKKTELKLIEQESIFKVKSSIYSKLIVFEGLMKEKLIYYNSSIEKMKELHRQIHDLYELMCKIETIQYQLQDTTDKRLSIRNIVEKR